MKHINTSGLLRGTFLFCCCLFLKFSAFAMPPQITGDTIVCVGGTLELETEFLSGAMYEWKNESGDILSTVHTLNLPDLEFSDAGFYTLTVVHDSYPEPDFTIEVVVTDVPAAPEISANGPLCEGETLLLSTPEAPDATYRWLDPFGNILTDAQELTIEDISENQAGIYTLEISQYGCTSPQSFVDVGVISVMSAPVLSADTLVCIGDSIRISTENFGEAEYFWEGPAGFFSSEAGEIIIPGAEEINGGTYSLVIAANGCETPAGTIDIDISEEVNGGWVDNVSVCEGLSVEAALNLAGNAPFEVFYSEGENGSIAESLDSSEGVLTLFPSTSTQYSLSRVVDANNCVWEGEDLLEVTVNEKPEFTDFTDNTCNNTNTEYFVQFSIENGTEPYEIIGQSGIFSGNVFTTQAITSGAAYSVRIEDANSCLSEELTGEHTCNCVTSVGSIDQNPLSFCTNETAEIIQLTEPTLDADDVFYYILHDSPNLFGSNFLAESTEPYFNFAAGMSPDESYYVTAVAGTDNGTGQVNGADLCLDVSGTVELIFSAQAEQPQIFGEAELCPGDFLQLETTPYENENAVISYVWTTPNSSFTTVNPSLFIENADTENTGLYQVEILVNACASETSSDFFLTVNVPEEEAITMADTVFCGNRTGILSANQPQGTTGLWTTDTGGNILSPTGNESSVSALETGINTFYWTLSSPVCPDYSTDSLSIELIAGPEAEDDYFVLEEDRFFMDIEPLKNDEIIEGETRFIEINEEPELGSIFPVSDDIFEYKRPLCYEGEVVFFYISCIETDLCPMLCDEGKITIDVQVDPQQSYLFIPDGITANGDGLNDYWVMEGIEKYPDNQLTIVNQAGQIVYSARPYSNEWNGEFKGRKLPEGTYYYILHTDVLTKEKRTGAVHLFR